jgi:hypothetical protein
MKRLFLLPLLVSTLFALDLTVTDDAGNYQIDWSNPSSDVTLVRGDYDDTYSIFNETTIYNGSGNNYLDTLGTKDTFYYRLEYSGGKTKVDINKEYLQDVLETHEVDITHDKDTLLKELQYGRTGKTAFLRWYATSELFDVELDYSGTKTKYTLNVADFDKTHNFYIIDNVNYLTSVSVYENGEKQKAFKLSLNISDETTTTDVAQIVEGTTRNISVNNGTINNYDEINTEINTENTTYNDEASNDTESLGTGVVGGDGGGGCFLR